MKYYVVKYTGKLGFIKSFMSVRDTLSISQKFLTPSIIQGMEMKLETNSVVRHKINFSNIATLQEQTRSKAKGKIKNQKIHDFSTGIIKIGYLVNPVLHLAFSKKEDAIKASTQHLCLCRLEDMIFPTGDILEMTDTEFSNLKGFELIFGDYEDSFLVGYNRFDNASKMYGKLEHVG